MATDRQVQPPTTAAQDACRIAEMLRKLMTYKFCGSSSINRVVHEALMPVASEAWRLTHRLNQEEK